MRFRNVGQIFVLLTTFVWSAQLIAQVGPQVLSDTPHRAPNYAQLPLTFERNRGQSESQVQFLARGRGYSVFVTAAGIVLSVRPSTATPSQRQGGGPANRKLPQPPPTDWISGSEILANLMDEGN